jgi:hypothetical protein
LAKAASGLAELGELVEGDLSGVEVVEGEVKSTQVKCLF